MMDAIRRIMGYLLYLPNITPLQWLFKSEVFPWAFLYSLRADYKLPTGYKIFIFYLSLSALWVFSGGSGWLIPARSFFALINASLIFFLLLSIGKKEFDGLRKAFDIVFAVNMVVVVAQTLNVFPEFLVPWIRLVLDRFMSGAEGYGRGVGGLFAEPSYASIAFHYYFAYFMLRKDINQKSALGLLLTVGMTLFDIFFVRSATGLVMISIYFISQQRWRDVWRGAIVVVLSAASILYISQRVVELPRSLDIAYRVVFEQEYQNLYDFVLLESGHRAIGVLGAYNYGFSHPLGAGLGHWPNASITAMESMGIDAAQIGYFEAFFDSTYDGVRPTSFAAGLMLEGGWIGFLLFFWAFKEYIFSKKVFENTHTRPIAILFLFNTLLLGTIGDPIPFIFLAYAYKKVHQPNDEPEPLPDAV